MTQAELITWLEGYCRNSVNNLFTEEDFTRFIESASSDTGFSLPTTSNAGTSWMQKRSLFHLVQSIILEKAEDFQIKQIHLEHPFEHYYKLLKLWSDEWAEAKNSDVELLAGDDPAAWMGTHIDAGFAYDSFGNDLTYDDEQQRKITPSN